jgi:hypothetical protein
MDPYVVTLAVLQGFSGNVRYDSIDEYRFEEETRLVSAGLNSGDEGLEGPLENGFDMRLLVRNDGPADGFCTISGGIM